MLRRSFVSNAHVVGRRRNKDLVGILEPTLVYPVDEDNEGVSEGSPRFGRRANKIPNRRSAGLDYAIKLAGGVAALHRAGIVHRDIKPENVILEAIREGRVPGLSVCPESS